MVRFHGLQLAPLLEQCTSQTDTAQLPCGAQRQLFGQSTSCHCALVKTLAGTMGAGRRQATPRRYRVQTPVPPLPPKRRAPLRLRVHNVWVVGSSPTCCLSAVAQVVEQNTRSSQQLLWRPPYTTSEAGRLVYLHQRPAFFTPASARSNRPAYPRVHTVISTLA